VVGKSIRGDLHRKTSLIIGHWVWSFVLFERRGRYGELSHWLPSSLCDGKLKMVSQMTSDGTYGKRRPLGRRTREGPCPASQSTKACFISATGGQASSVSGQCLYHGGLKSAVDETQLAVSLCPTTFDVQLRNLMSTPVAFFGLRPGFCFRELFPHSKRTERH
jgi:hypothetical protein